jgi:hypothetical protein
MASVIFKKLFEVHVLHDYYLTKANLSTATNSYFSLSTANQSTLLQNVLHLDKFDINEYLEIKPDPETRELFKQYSMRFIPTPLGFFLGAEVRKTETILGSGSVLSTYKPYYALPDGFHLQFIIQNKDSQFENIAEQPSPSPYQANYFFTNQNAAASKIFPALSEGASGLLHPSDLKLLPFRLGIPAAIGTALKVILEDSVGNVLVEKEKLTTKQITVLNLQDFGYSPTDQPPIPDGQYTLKIEENTVPVLNEKFFFSNRLYRNTNLGVLDIFIDAQDPPYDLLDTDGNLKTRLEVDTGGTRTITPHPIFELRIEGDFS